MVAPAVPKPPKRTYASAARKIRNDHDESDEDDIIEEATVALLRTKDYTNVSKLADRDHLTDENWHEWKDRMKRVFKNCDIIGYIDGSIIRPEDDEFPVGASNWDKNDTWAQQVIIQNVTSSQMNHVGSKDTAEMMYSALSDTHENKAHQTVNHLQTLLYETKATESDDLLKHFDTLKSYRDRLNKFPNPEFHVYDVRFKSIISASLPATWQTFVEPYNGNANDPNDPDPKRRMTSDAFIGLLREEYRMRINRLHNGNNSGASGSTNLANGQSTVRSEKTLKNRIAKRKESLGPYCDHCKRKGHWTTKCRKFPGNKCYNCGKFGHHAKDCRSEKKKGKEKARDRGGSSNEANFVDAHITFATVEEVAMDEDVDMGNAYNFDTYNDCTAGGNDERLIYYDWLADTATTSHVACNRDAFTSYTPSKNITVTGVGGKEAPILGRGTVELNSTCNGNNYILRLEDVLHVPGQRNNLISLGRWDNEGRRYIGGNGMITLVTKDGRRVAQGKKVNNNLYRMSVSVRKPTSTPSKNNTVTPKTFAGNEPSLSWETWHRRFGHISYSGLQKLLDNNMVDGFNVDIRSPKPDCVACTEAKQHVEPFPKSTNRKTEPGEITHIDLWGKYAIRSINGNQYYIVFVDDAKRFTTVDFLKEKSDAAQAVINYLAHLIAQGRTPKGIQIDRGKEFVNEKLEGWCKQHGIEIRLTAPYSPSQNGVAERMNRTLVELGRAMITANDLPEFLWEHAILHAVYLRNRSYTKPLGTITPYQGWYDKKPNVAHLREFGAPVWILLQGQKEDRKMLPKSKRKVYVGFDDGAKAVKYYNAETRKVLTSRNFKHLNPPQTIEPPEPVILTPQPRHEGESGGSGDMPLLGVPGPDDETRDLEPGKRKRKRVEEPIDVDVDEPRKTRGIRTDYRQLQDPFEEEDDETSLTFEALSIEELYALIAGDELTTLQEAKRSPDWPEWQKSMKEELDVLSEMGTWELVPKPPNAVPISNKWTFLRKRNKEGEIVRYRARLVVRGFAQRPGHDYMETFSPVVRMDTLRAILALVPIKDLKVQQMDVKGAYLNGILHETIYMKQPEGCEDGTDRVCKLLKAMYGLKQAGREWNKQLDAKLREHGYRRLRSDPCVYVRWDGDDIAIITVWVDDLLLFASSDKAMAHMKNAIKSEWEITDLGEPRKIVGIEITIDDNSITISQQKYVENLLRKEGMADANPVGMPLDPHVKLAPNPESNEPNRSNSYAKLLGELQYLANCTRPDISYAVNRLGAYTANPSLQHYGALKRILRYLAGTKTLGITYRKPQDANDDDNLFHGFSDAAFANQDDGKSTSGYVFLASGGAITWKSKKQTVIALSSTESEYVALAESGREASWLRNLYGELGFPQIKPTIIKGDNEGSVSMTHDPQFHQRSKHIALRHHWVRELVNNDVLDIQNCRDPEQTADVLTKALPKPKHTRHTGEMGVQPTDITR
jgi:hypothetical protein